MFEVGKKYTKNDSTYDTGEYVCIGVGVGASSHMGCLRYLPYGGIAVWPDSSKFTEVKPKVKVDFWVNIYSDTTTHNSYVPHQSKEQADRGAILGRVACIHIQQEVEEGTGL